jgi:2-polyprenyl-3-methyl-5-hydroxy-6-metoxy-1,4-benzoquinol methylase
MAEAGKNSVLESGVIAGNYFDKYTSSNPVHRWLLKRFLGAIEELVRDLSPSSVHEVGCGEGALAARLAPMFTCTFRATDFSQQIVVRARALHGDSGVQFQSRSIYELTPTEDTADLVLCCEVMEHLDRPEEALRKLHAVTRKWCVLSVPREPLWSTLNLARGKYISRLGNTPGHVQRWSRAAFVGLVSNYFEVEAVVSPVPWTIVRARKIP